MPLNPNVGGLSFVYNVHDFFPYQFRCQGEMGVEWGNKTAKATEDEEGEEMKLQPSSEIRSCKKGVERRGAGKSKDSREQRTGIWFLFVLVSMLPCFSSVASVQCPSAHLLSEAQLPLRWCNEV
uniref:Uncharacterized protein n=1 Tax=Palpitomonas bilix TaxID=652834 RepID=A0A7S3GDZ0_9EUKA|mmetsp:Transcript_45132/g.116758  ORF Transcript_45132/g.116758 Transcript_45132/m.116758 type:complete len:124 (+) Transcript_45132:1004-1375(+)